MRQVLRVVMLAVIVVPSAFALQGDKRFGELAVLTERADFPERSPGGYEKAGTGFHYVSVIGRVKNIGTHALCISIHATLKTTFDLETTGSVRLGPRNNEWINQLLPNEELNAEFVFRVKDGILPVALVVGQLLRQQSCGHNNPYLISGPLTVEIPFKSIPQGDVTSASSQPALLVGSEALSINMTREEAFRQLSRCCQSRPLGERMVVVSYKDKAAGTVYFEHDRVVGIASERNSSTERGTKDSALAFYRLVDQLSHGTPTEVMMYSQTRESSNGTTKTVFLQLGTGRKIMIRLFEMDPGRDMLDGVTVSECVGNCADW